MGCNENSTEPVVTLVPGFIEAHSGIQFGTPTPIKTRVTTVTAGFAWLNKEWDGYGLDEQTALVSYAFEAGREYQRSRKLQKRIDAACNAGWNQYHQEQVQLEIERHIGEGI